MCKCSAALGLSVTSEETAYSVISIPVNMGTELCWDLEEKDIKELQFHAQEFTSKDFMELESHRIKSGVIEQHEAEQPKS